MPITAVQCREHTVQFFVCKKLLLVILNKRFPEKTNVFFRVLPERMGGRPLPDFFSPFSAAEFLVNKKS